MEKSKDIEAPAIPAVATTASTTPQGQDAASKSSLDAGEGVPEADYSSKATNKTTFTHYLVTLSLLISINLTRALTNYIESVFIFNDR